MLEWMTLKEWHKTNGLFKKPKMRVYFGFWSPSKLSLFLGNWILKHKNNEGKLYNIICWIYNKISRTDPTLPVWRRGNLIRWGKPFAHYELSKGYVWNKNIQDKLDKLHLSWLKPEFETPVWFCFHLFKWDVVWKDKYERPAYEYPPQFTIVICNISLSFHWHAPTNNNDCLDDDRYWESMLTWNRYMDMSNYTLYCLVDKMGHITSYQNEKQSIKLFFDYNFIKDARIRKKLKTYCDKKLCDIKRKYKLITCPKCGRTMYIKDDIVLTTNPPQYQYYCSKCGEIKYLSEKLEPWEF